VGLNPVMSRPFRAHGCGMRPRPRALPWAGMYRPFGAVVAGADVRKATHYLPHYNPGELLPPLTPDSLRVPHRSLARNARICEPLFLTRHIEKAGTGILDMIGLCKAAKLRPPEFRQEMGQFIQTLWRPTAATGAPVEAPAGTQSALSRHQVEILRKCQSDSTLVELMTVTGRSDRTKFRHQVMNPLLERGLIEMTTPDKPTSRLQKYRLTDKGRAGLSRRGGAEST